MKAAQSILLCLFFAAPTLAATPKPKTITFRDPKTGLTFKLPSSWRGYRVLHSSWDAVTQRDEKPVVYARGPIIVLRHPHPGNIHPDMRLWVFTRHQWAGNVDEDCIAGGCVDEICHNRKYVLAQYSRDYNNLEPRPMREAYRILAMDPTSQEPLNRDGGLRAGKGNE